MMMMSSCCSSGGGGGGMYALFQIESRSFEQRNVSALHLETCINKPSCVMQCPLCQPVFVPVIYDPHQAFSCSSMSYISAAIALLLAAFFSPCSAQASAAQLYT